MCARAINRYKEALTLCVLFKCIDLPSEVLKYIYETLYVDLPDSFSECTIFSHFASQDKSLFSRLTNDRLIIDQFLFFF
ncbi:hypothetical protein ANTRET_LOCUS10881 [Anthophora retusa]